MRRRNLFSRESEKIVAKEKRKKEKYEIFCEIPLLEYCITNWSRNMGWEFNDFGEFLELIGVKTPAKVSEFNGIERSFKCISSKGEVCKIYIFFDEIHLEKNGEKAKFKINYNIRNGETIPKVTRI